jgi:NTP pyrophosphatase (non-canonical NTP hydrolase)
LIALSFYRWTIEEDVIFSRDDEIKEKLLQTILRGASEITEELKEVFEEILKNNWRNYRDSYYDLIKAILSELGDNLEVIKALPNYVLRLADLFWFKASQREEDDFYTHSIDMDGYFCMEEHCLEYFPASAYQTPIYWLLQFSFEDTINFILDFTNKTVLYFAESDFAKDEIEEIEIFIDDNKLIRQYVSNRLWNIYRGTQAAPSALESMHMALEKYLLENGKEADSRTLEYWLLYLLNKSKSASITAIVTSITLAYPEKTFNIAKILFKTKELFLFDTVRFTLDLQQRDQLLFLRDFCGGYSGKEFYEEERLKACDDEHRKKSLESLALTYQFFRSEGVMEEEAKERQEIIWKILDKYYSGLPDKTKETESDKTWRLYLARMDRRKMKPKIEEDNGKTLISFNPEVDPALKEYSEKSLQESSEPMKYTALKLWANYKMKNDNRHEQYMQYENNHQLVLKETKEIVKYLAKSKDDRFHLFNHSIPAYACSVLIRDHFKDLSEKERGFCKRVILKKASSFFRKDYQYQMSDGVECAIFVLPILLKYFPSEKETIKKILLLALFDPNHLGTDLQFSTYSVRAIICNLWEISFEDAQSILMGYLLLKPKYEEQRERLLEKRRKKYIYEFNESEIRKWLVDKNKEDLQKVIGNRISIKDLKEIEELDLDILNTAFQLIPLKTSDGDHKEIVKIIISAFSKDLLSDRKEDKIDYFSRYTFLEKLAYFILSFSESKDISEYLKPFIDNFNGSKAIAELFQEFILAEDRLNAYKNFWQVWEMFREKVSELCKNGERNRYAEEIIKSYLFAQTRWNNKAIDWDTLKEDNKPFFKKVTEDIGHCPSAIYSVSKLLNGIGGIYLDDDGIYWISTMLKKNTSIQFERLEADTIYYLENLIKKYIYKNRERVKRIKKVNSEVQIVLNFLVEKGSVMGYMLREDII